MSDVDLAVCGFVQVAGDETPRASLSAPGAYEVIEGLAEQGTSEPLGWCQVL